MKEMRRIIALVLTLVMVVGLMPVSAFAAEEPVVVISGSDYQASSSGTTMKDIIDEMNYSSIDGVLMGGDYNGGSTTYSSATEVKAVDTAITAAGVSTDADRIYVQGNHDQYLDPSSSSNLLTTTGAHDTEDYGVYAINYKDFGSASSGLKSYLDGKAGYTKPIFVITHQPLHKSWRGDNNNAIKIANVLNSYEDLNIIFLFGHNHSSTYDDYLGGGSIYLPKGSSMMIAGGDGNPQTINFTYMNCGYVGYCNNSSSTCKHLTMTAFEIYEDEVIVRRYDASGEHSCGLKAKGVEVRGYAADITTVASGAKIQLVEETPEPQPTTEATTVPSTAATEPSTEATEPSTEATEPSSEATEPSTAPSDPSEPTDGEDPEVDSQGIVINGAELTANVTAAEVVEIEGVTNSVAYEIPAVLAEGATEATVSIPVPASWVVGELKVYCIVDGAPTDEEFDGTYADGFYTFTTSHFSKWQLTNTVTQPDDGTAFVPGVDTSQNKDVWVKVDTLSNNGEYLIVTTGTAGTNGYIMGNSTASTPISGTLTVNGTTGTYTYFETATGTLWTASGSGTSWSFQNSNNRYLGYDSSNSSFGSSTYYSYTLNNNAENAVTWTFEEDTLSINLVYRDRTYGTDTYNDYYVIGGRTSWSMDTDFDDVYFYQKVNATVHSGTQDATYGINITVDDVATNEATISSVVNGETKQLGTEFTTTVNGQYPSGGDYTWTVLTNNGAASVNTNGLLTFTGAYGTEVVKVSYTWTVNNVSYTIYNTLTIHVVEPEYVLAIDQGESHTQRGVKQNDTFQLTATLTADDVAVENPTLAWSCYLADGSSAEAIVSIDPATGLLTFTGAEGTFRAEVTYTTPSGLVKVDVIEITTRKSTAVTPSESTTDFPRWPDEGAIRFDKTASAVGNFSETGIAQVELSMAGLPVSSGGDIDVIIMLDRSTSMGANDITPTQDATVAMLQALLFKKGATVFDETTFNEKNGHRIYIGYYMGYGEGAVHDITTIESAAGTSTTMGFQIINDFEEYSALVAKLRSQYTNQTSTSGTDWSFSLKKCYDILVASKDDSDNPQHVVFMTDGAPGAYAVDADPDHDENLLYNRWVSSNGSRSTSYRYEYWSTLIKKNMNVPVYGILVNETGAQQKYLMNDISGPAGEVTPDTGSDTNKLYNGPDDFSVLDENDFFFMCDTSNASHMNNLFSAVGEKINKSAASNVEVSDTIGNNYDLIFELPAAFDETEMKNAGLEGQEFYLEILDYPLDEDTHERTGVATVKQRVYLAKVDGKVVISKILTGSIAADGTETLTEADKNPVFTAKENEEDKAYYNWNDDGDGIVENGEYSYVANGTGSHHLTAGAYLVLNTDGSLKVLNTPYFVYDGSDTKNEKLTWTVTKMSQDSETALRYFAYLNGSGGVTPADQIAAGTYYTNEEASLTYNNFNGTECQQFFPKPQMTWNGAQVSYVFYLVNDDGVPVNRSGQPVKFAEAVFVTDIHTYSIVWNDLEQSAGLEAAYLAEGLIPDDYSLFDEDATYSIHVYENEKAVNLNNHFVIGGTAGDTTTYVYNNKTDVKKFNTHGAYAATSTYFCKNAKGGVVAELDDNGQIITDSVEFTAAAGETQVTKAEIEAVGGSTNGATEIGGYLYYVDENGEVYTIVKRSNATSISGFDYANTTVAFAVKWEKKLADDTVVVDFGLPVDINVTSNDFVYNHINGIAEALPDGITGNNQSKDNAAFNAKELTIGEHTAKVQNENTIRFTPGGGDSMIFNEPVSFYYESPVEIYVDGEIDTDYMYAKVTVIPATTVYYEDSFVDFAVSTKTDGVWGVDNSKTWAIEGAADIGATQAQDRPGASQISSALDADNLYGFDQAYEKRSTYSLGSARKISVTPDLFGTATFTFYGTGFDVIGLTSNNTGFITVSVYEGDTATGTALKTFGVDTYYGYSYLPCKITMQRTHTGWYESARDVVTEAEYNAGNKEKPGNEIVLPNGSITYYYEMRWVATPGNGDNSNSIYQIPVISADLLAHGLTYGQYTVVVKCAYNKYLDHTNDPESMSNHTADSYDFFLDAIRIYNPTGGNNDIANGAYEKDGERWPIYEELRSRILTTEAFNILGDSGIANGIVFIDGNDEVYNLEDYRSYGPNNEVYLDKNQAVSFELVAPEDGLKTIQLGLKNVQGNSSVKVYGVSPDYDNDKIGDVTEEVAALGQNTVSSTITDGIITTVNVVYEEVGEGEYLKHTVTMVYRIVDCLDMDLATATDMNYDITKLNGRYVVVLNDSTAEGNVVSITNIKATFADACPIGLIIDGKTEYVEGEPYVAPTVKVYYADGTSRDITSVFEGENEVDTDDVDVHELSYDYTETINGVDYDVSATFTVTVVAKDGNTPAAASAETAADYSIMRVTRKSVAYALASLNEPEYVEPEATEPEATEPEATEPEATEPEATEPEATEPKATEPETTEPEVTEPEATEPEATKPENNGSQNNKPEADKPDSNKPEADNNVPGAAAPEGGNINGDDSVVDDSKVEIPDGEPDEAPETGDEPVEEVTGFWGLLKKVVEFLFGWLLKLK